MTVNETTQTNPEGRAMRVPDIAAVYIGIGAQKFVRISRGHFVCLQSARATVLTGKLEIIIFEEVVHEDDELAHTGGHGYEWFFSSGEQAQIKLFKDAVVADGTQGGHVERAAHGAAAATDVAHAFLTTAVT